jgi:hypothetical protein
MILRITDARKSGAPGSPLWWGRAAQSAMKGHAPHGIGQLILDPSVTHVDVFPTEVGDIWRWAESFEGWIYQGHKQLKAEPFDSTESKAPHVSDESLVSFRGIREPQK